MADDLDRLVATARGWLAAGHRAAIATVVESWGSAPRRAGAHLIARDDALFEGSVSGGCVEGEVIAASAEVLAGGPSRVLEFGVADETAWRVGLACGGRIRVLVQPLDERGFAPALLDAVAEARGAGRAITLHSDLASGRTGAEPIAGGFARRYEPALRLAIVGAVHIAQSLAPIAARVGYAVTIIDPRSAFAAAARFDDAALDARWPDEALADWKPDAASAVVALTHDPKLDDVALASALATPAFYVAALGSRGNHARRLERLAARGVAAGDLARVHGPAGLAIGAAEPAEIALAIAAQMVAAWRARALA